MMNERIVKMPERDGSEITPDSLQYYPASQVSGTEWILDALSDLANYCASNEISDVETTLRRAIWEASLQLNTAR